MASRRQGFQQNLVSLGEDASGQFGCLALSKGIPLHPKFGYPRIGCLEGAMAESALERMNSPTRKRTGLSSLLVIVGVLSLAAAGWAVGLRMGYGYAKRDVATIAGASADQDVPAIPEWRRWADADIAYRPPSYETGLFNAAALPLPGGDGITTADVFNGYQRRLESTFFNRRGTAPRFEAAPVPKAVRSAQRRSSHTGLDADVVEVVPAED
jgi:hypothetical protein